MRKKWYTALLILTATAACSRPHEIITDIPYTDPPESERQKLDLYIPGNPKPMPCLVWIHGGAWLAGSKAGLAPEIDTLLHHGFVIASIGYRLSSEAIFPAQIRDCKSAIRFLKENASKYNIDPSRIAVAGASAGGHLAALLGTSGGVRSLEDIPPGTNPVSSRVQAVIDFYGPTDFLIMDELPGECRDPMRHLVPDSPESRLLGCNIEDCPDRVAMANPISYVSEDDPPFLIFHGRSDCTVTPKSSLILEEALAGKGVPVELHLLDGAGHGGKAFHSAEIKSRVLHFLKSVLE